MQSPSREGLVISVEGLFRRRSERPLFPRISTVDPPTVLPDTPVQKNFQGGQTPGGFVLQGRTRWRQTNAACGFHSPLSLSTLRAVGDNPIPRIQQLFQFKIQKIISIFFSADGSSLAHAAAVERLYEVSL